MSRGASQNLFRRSGGRFKHGDYHEHHCWYRGGAAMVGYERDGQRRAKAIVDTRRKLTVEEAGNRARLRLFVPFKDYRAVYWRPAE